MKCKWVCLQTDAIKILGIYFSYDKQIANNKNFIRLIIGSRALLNIWNQRWLSLYGKIEVFKSLIVSKPVVVVIWNDKTPKIKHSILIGDYTYASLKDMDIRSKLSSFKFSWFKEMVDEKKTHIHGMC